MNTEVKIPSDKVESIVLKKDEVPFTSKLKSIKLILTVVFVSLFVWLLKDKSISEVSFVNLISIIVISYFTANTTGKFTKR